MWGCVEGYVARAAWGSAVWRAECRLASRYLNQLRASRSSGKRRKDERDRKSSQFPTTMKCRVEEHACKTRVCREGSAWF